MDASLLQWLRCPLCGGTFSVSAAAQGTDQLVYEILSCYCSRYPVVAGIPILQQGVIGGTRQTSDKVIALIEASRYREALFSLLTPPSPALAPTWMRGLPSIRGVGRLKTLAHRWALRTWQGGADALLRGRTDQVTACDLFDLYFRRSGSVDAYNHFAFRFSQPRHLVALSFASLIRKPPKPVLDLACGFGHLTCDLVRRAHGQLVVGVDRIFFMLYVAKNWVAPEAEYVCCEADVSLPFPAGTFSAVFCSDAFHDFVNKAASIRTLQFLTQHDGLILLVALRNALLNRWYSSRLLPPEGYQALVADMPHCVVDDSEILTRYLRKQGPSLARSADMSRLASSPWLSVVASQSRDIFRDHGPFTEWPHAAGRLALNPLYTGERRNGCKQVHLRRRFPASFYEKDNGECKQYLPEAITIDAAVTADLAHGRRTPEINKLVEQFVVLGIPSQYW